MEKNNYLEHFAIKLNKLLIEKGYGSTRGNGKIDFKSLASIAGCSYQMARKYALGELLPDLRTIIRIADYLNCHPSYLLFDELPEKICDKYTKDTIHIDKDLLTYILTKSSSLLARQDEKEDIVTFIVEAIYDASNLNVELNTIHKIIDMMFSSASLIWAKKNKDRAIKYV